MTRQHVFPFLLCAILLSACVPAKKYQDMETAKMKSDNDAKSCQTALTQSQNENRTLLADMQKQNKQINALVEDTTAMGQRYRTIKDLNQEVERLYKELLAQNDALIANSSSESRALSEEVARLQADIRLKEIELARKEGEMNSLKGDLNVKTENNEQLQGDLAARTATINQLEKDLQQKEARLAQLEQDLAIREMRVKELEDLITQQEAKAAALKKSVNDALLGFSASDLSVEERNGKVYVSLSQNLLFESGSRNLDTKGKAAIRTLAGVLKKNEEIEITIEGHTDNVGETSNNWDLSVLRATTIVKELVKSGVKPEKIMAAGRGEHFPIASNVASDGRAKNRRTEIILSPKLDDLYDLLKN